MSNQKNPTIERLPVELIHQIFDYLDAETIIFSVQCVCRSLRLFVSSYNRFVLNCELISKPNFNVLCRLIKPENVISLKLSNDDRTSDQINSFLSLVNLRKLTRLRFLVLIDIDEAQFNFILKRITANLLVSFSFGIRRSDDRRINTTNKHLVSLITQTSLRKLEMKMPSLRISKISLPTNSKIQYLTVNECIHANDLNRILQCSSSLHTIILREGFNGHFNTTDVGSSRRMYFQQLRSLTIENNHIDISAIESFLSLTPSLVYLKLIYSNKSIDGKRWEQFIQINLPQLDKFEFYFSGFYSTLQTVTDLESILNPFRTSFWIEYKKWFVALQSQQSYMASFDIYSIPICKSNINYVSESKVLLLSTDPMMTNNNSSTTYNIHSLTLDCHNLTTHDLLETKTSNILFSKVTNFTIKFWYDVSPLLLQSCVRFIDISKLAQITVHCEHFYKYSKNLFKDLEMFITQANNLNILIFKTSGWSPTGLKALENIYPILPTSIKHLQIGIHNTDEIKFILERCKHLSTIKLNFRYSTDSYEIIKWFDDNTINSTCRKDLKSIAIWLGKRNIQSNNINIHPKRIKVD